MNEKIDKENNADHPKRKKGDLPVEHMKEGSDLPIEGNQVPPPEKTMQGPDSHE